MANLWRDKWVLTGGKRTRSGKVPPFAPHSPGELFDPSRVHDQQIRECKFMKNILLAFGLAVASLSAGTISAAMPSTALPNGLSSTVQQVDWSCGPRRHREGDGQCYPNQYNNRRSMESCGPGRVRGGDGQCYASRRQAGHPGYYGNDGYSRYSCGPGRVRGGDGECYPVRGKSCGAGRHRGPDGQCYAN